MSKCVWGGEGRGRAAIEGDYKRRARVGSPTSLPPPTPPPSLPASSSPPPRHRWVPGDVFWQNIGASFANSTPNALALLEVWIALSRNILLQNLQTTGQNQLNRVLFDRRKLGVRGNDLLSAPRCGGRGGRGVALAFHLARGAYLTHGRTHNTHGCTSRMFIPHLLAHPPRLTRAVTQRQFSIASAKAAKAAKNAAAAAGPGRGTAEAEAVQVSGGGGVSTASYYAVNKSDLVLYRLGFNRFNTLCGGWCGCNSRTWEPRAVQQRDGGRYVCQGMAAAEMEELFAFHFCCQSDPRVKQEGFGLWAEGKIVAEGV